MERYLKDEPATLALGAALAHLCQAPCVMLLHGELGAGKTTLVRGFLRELGHAGAVKSPTYTLVEPYACKEVQVFHFDLYRLAEPAEVEFMGLRDYLEQDAICLIEWPERGAGHLPQADIDIYLEAREDGRQARLLAHSQDAEALLVKLEPF